MRWGIRLASLGSVIFACALASPRATAGIVDPVNDFLPTYTGPRAGDVDVLETEVLLDTIANQFRFSARLAAPVGTTAGALYVWGIDRGQGTARFVAGSPSVGAGVLFDAVVIARPDGTGNFNDLLNGANSAALTAGSVTINGDRIVAVVPVSLVPSTGFTVNNFTFNLWPRVGAGSNAQISDFAPNASNFALNVTPEPSSLLCCGLAVVAVGIGRAMRGPKRD